MPYSWNCQHNNGFSVCMPYVIMSAMNITEQTNHILLSSQRLWAASLENSACYDEWKGILSWSHFSGMLLMSSVIFGGNIRCSSYRSGNYKEMSFSHSEKHSLSHDSLFWSNYPMKIQ